MKKKLTPVTLEDVLKLISSLEPEKYILIVQPTGPNRSLEYLEDKLNLAKLSDGIDALFFRTTFCNLEEAREFVAEYLIADVHWQGLALGIFHEGGLVWEGK